MSSYTVGLGDDVLFGGGKKKVKFGKTKLGKLLIHTPIVQAAKFVVHPIKQTKAAIKTIARFDPTAKTAKYGNITKGGLLVGGAVAATLLTGGAAAPIASKVAAVGLQKAITPVRKPAPRITPSIEQNVATEQTTPSGEALYHTNPINAFTDVTAPTSSGPTDVESYGGAQTVKSGSSSLILLGIVAVVGIGFYLSRKKASVV